MDPLGLRGGLRGALKGTLRVPSKDLEGHLQGYLQGTLRGQTLRGGLRGGGGPSRNTLRGGLRGILRGGLRGTLRGTLRGGLRGGLRGTLKGTLRVPSKDLEGYLQGGQTLRGGLRGGLRYPLRAPSIEGVGPNMDSLVEAAFRKVVKRTHPDKGGKLADQQRLQSTRERWRALRAARPTDRARPKVSSDLLPVQVAEPSGSKPCFIVSSSVLLTYHNLEASAWDSFIDFLQGRLLLWGELHWCASMEECQSGRPHIHIMFQFLST